MSNHFHIVLHVDPSSAAALTKEDVASRWLAAFPGPLQHDHSKYLAQRMEASILSDPGRVKELRKRLGSLSWFMKALNEPIARMANREDYCKGKFWEGRFKCQVLLESQAVLSCMAYVDLNPARAAMCNTLAESKHTSIQKRLNKRASSKGKLKNEKSLLDRPLKPVAGLNAEGLLDLTESSYIELVQWTGEHARSDKRGKLKSNTEGPRAAPAAIWQVSNHPDAWLRQVQGTESIYYRAIGSAQALMAKAEELGQAWMKGVASEVAKALMRERPS